MLQFHNRRRSTPPYATVAYTDHPDRIVGVDFSLHKIGERNDKVKHASTVPIRNGKRTSLRSPIPFFPPGLPQPLQDILSFQTSSTIEFVRQLTKEQSVWGIETVCSEICRRDPRTSFISHPQYPQGKLSSTFLSALFQVFFSLHPDSMISFPCCHESSGAYHSSQLITTYPNQTSPSSSSNVYWDQLYSPIVDSNKRVSLLIHDNQRSSFTNLGHFLGEFRAPQAPKTADELLGLLPMTELFELFVLIVSKCPESFGCAIQNDISLFIHPYGKSYDDLIDLLPSRNRLLMTKVIATTRHWARCETVDIMGKRYRHSIESSSRDDLSLAGFGDISQKELAPIVEHNRDRLRRLAIALFSSSSARIGDCLGHYYGERDNYIDEDRFPPSSIVESPQSPLRVIVKDKDAVKILENLILLHENVDQIEPCKDLADTYSVLSLPPWRTNIKKDMASIPHTHNTKKTMLHQAPFDGHVSFKTDVAQLENQPHYVSAFVPSVPVHIVSSSDNDSHTTVEDASSVATNCDYNYKTSYWQFRYRQSHPHRSTAPSQYSTPRTRPLDIFVPQTNFPSESSNVILSTKTAPSLPTTTRIDDTSNALIGPSKPIQNHRPTTTSAASIEGPVEFIRPPMKDLYSAPIPIDPCKGRLISTEILMSNATAATSIPRLPKYVTSAIETPRIKAERKRPTPITLMPSPSNTVLSRPTTTTSVSPTTVESFITKMSSRSSEEQEEDYSPTARRGWRIWDKPFQSWKRKSFHKILLLPENPVPPLPSFTDRIENTNAVFTPGVSSPIAVPISTVPKISSDDVNTTDRSKKLPTRPGLAPRCQSSGDINQSRTSGLTFATDSSDISSCQSLCSSLNDSPRIIPSSSIGCSIASISFPENYMSLSAPHSNSFTSEVWSPSPSILTPGFPSPMEFFPMVTSISPLPASPTSSIASRKKRLQDRIFGKLNKKTSSSADELYFPPIPHTSALPLTGNVGAGEHRPILKSASSFNSLREIRPLGHHFATHVLATHALVLPERGGRTRKVGSRSEPIAVTVQEQNKNQVNTASCPCHERTDEKNGYLQPLRRDPQTPLPPVLSSCLSSSPLPSDYQYNQCKVNSSSNRQQAQQRGKLGLDERKANREIWKVMDQWDAWWEAQTKH